jgi:hypothetical protein
LVVAEGLVGGDVGGGDPEEVVGIAEESFGVADLRDLGQAALEVGDRLAIMLTRRGQATARPAVLISSWVALLVAGLVVVGRSGLGTLLTAAFILQVTPSLWTAYRTAHLTGVAAGTWLLILGELSCWTIIGVHKSDPRLLTLGVTGLTASALMLARIRRSDVGTAVKVRHPHERHDRDGWMVEAGCGGGRAWWSA